MKKSLETNIRLKAAVIYTIAAILCALLLLYIYHLNQSINERRDKISDYNREFAETERLIDAVNHAQSEANLYITTKRHTHLYNFHNTLRLFNADIDSIKRKYPGTPKDSIVTAIGSLLDEKGRIITELGDNLRNTNALDTVSSVLNAIAPLHVSDTLIVRSTTTTDTVVSLAPPEKRRRRHHRNEEPPTDSLMVVKSTVDTVSLQGAKHYEMVSKASGLVAKATRDYTEMLGAIERDIKRLVGAEQEISTNISRLLVKLYREAVLDNMDNIGRRESEVRRITVISFIGSVAAMILILVFIILIISDVNKGKAAREALQLANERTRQIMESRHQLLLSVSHDIKTPLSSILGYLELGSSGMRLSGKEIAAMQASGKHIAALLENLLGFSALEKGSVEKDEQAFYLSEVCDEIREIFIPLAARKNLRFETSFRFDTGLRLFADSLKIKQIAVNILSNAVKYTLRGEIRFEASWDGATIRLVATDTGAGIPADRMNDLFKPFSRIKQNSSLAKGSGLGLYVVKGLSELLGGTVGLESAEGSGTRVTVTIPATVLEHTHVIVPQKRIAVIDDDIPLMKAICNMFKRLGHICTITDTFEAAKALSRDMHTYDLIITDMEMGSTSGEDILKKMRQRGCTVPVVVMTGRSDFNRAEASRAGFDGYLRKPVTIAALMDMVGETAEASVRGSNRMDDARCGTESLSDMFDGDKEILMEITRVFVSSSIENISALEKAAAHNDFMAAQGLCHKMLPMFMQMGADEETVAIMKKMDAARDKSAFTYPAWKKDTELIVRLASAFIASLREGQE